MTSLVEIGGRRGREGSGALFVQSLDIDNAVPGERVRDRAAAQAVETWNLNDALPRHAWLNDRGGKRNPPLQLPR